MISFVTPVGKITYYAKGRRFVAHCTETERHGKLCRKQKFAYRSASTPGQGRPLGYLMAWLENSNFDTHRAHIDETVYTPLEIRAAARQRLHDTPGSEVLFACEAVRLDGESDEPIDHP